LEFAGSPASPRGRAFWRDRNIDLVDNETMFAKSTKTGTRNIVEFVVLLAIVAFWFALQAWILPAAGVPT
jgi:hypothetical protein